MFGDFGRSKIFTRTWKEWSEEFLESFDFLGDFLCWTFVRDEIELDRLSSKSSKLTIDAGTFEITASCPHWMSKSSGSR